MPPAELSQLIAVILQVAAALAIAAAVWVLAGRKKCGFGRYVGLSSAPRGAIFLGATVGVAFTGVVLLVPSFRDMASGPNTVAGSAIREVSLEWSVPVLLALAIFKTAFSEELLFRGLIGKRLIALFGFNVGNSLQALLFGTVHLFIFWLAKPLQALAAALFVLLITALGWVAGWLNEKRGEGSIVPGWTAHAVANVIAYLAVALWIL